MAALPPDTADGAVYCRRTGRWRSLDTGVGVPPPSPADMAAALDQALRAPGAARDTTVRELLDATRAAGLRLLPVGTQPDDARDGAFAARLLSVVGGVRRSAAVLPEGLSVALASDIGKLPGTPWSHNYQPDPDRGQPPDPIVEPEADTAPSAWFGVAEPACPTDPADEAVWGRTDQIINDLRQMGAGAIRRCKWRDVYWGSLFPLGEDALHGAQVLPPADILEALRADGWARLAAFHELLLMCRLGGIQMAITPWNPGGGSVMNVATEGAARSMDKKSPLRDDGGAIEDGWWDLWSLRPAWQLGVRVLSTRGFDAFYWDPTTMSGVSPTDDQVFFQRYAMQVWPTRPSDPVDSDPYTRECARRKSLAIAAFCQGVAEFLAELHGVWGPLFQGTGIYDVVDTVELGNELNGLFAFSADDVSESVLAASERETGRTMALLAMPMRHLLPSMRFRAAELSSWNPAAVAGPCCPEQGCCVTDSFDQRLSWLRDTIGVGLVHARDSDLLMQYAYALFITSGGTTTMPDGAFDWALTCAHAGYWWPPRATDPADVLTLRATDLVHEAGFHWYHGYNCKVDADGNPYRWIHGYQDAVRLAADADRFRTVVIDGLRPAGFELACTVGEVGFPAVFPAISPAPVPRDTITAPLYEGTNPLLHAGMVARYLLLFRTLGVARMSWFCPYLKPSRALSDGSIAAWTSPVAGSGLHNDVALPDQVDDFARLAAWRRPAWFTYRRVAWLLSLAEDAGTIMFNAAGTTVIRYRLRDRLSMMPGARWRYRYLWVAWLDQYADDDCLHGAHAPGDDATDAVGPTRVSVLFYDSQGHGYEQVSLVPDVGPGDVSGEVDDNGYRQVTPRDWYWTGWDGAVNWLGELAGDDTRFIGLDLAQADPDHAPAPVALLCDADSVMVVG